VLWSQLVDPVLVTFGWAIMAGWGTPGAPNSGGAGYRMMRIGN
jgi:hypothetical protein